MTTPTELPEIVKDAVAALSIIEAWALDQLPGYYGNIDAVASDFGLDAESLQTTVQVIHEAINTVATEKADRVALHQLVIEWLKVEVGRLDAAWDEATEKLALQ